MVRESGISATRPVFPIYLLPTLKLPFRRRSSADSSSSSSSAASTSSAISDPPASSASSAGTTPAGSLEHDGPLTKSTKAIRNTRLAQAAPDTLRCSTCSADLALASQIISKGFTGRYGRAFLVAPPPAPAASTLLNIRVGKNENRQLVTGWHVVADIVCGTCQSKLGWKYVDAKETAQKYKVGKFILEVERVVTYRSWEDVEAEDAREVFDDDDDGGERDDGNSSDVSFDSDDDEECDDIFAGTWDPGVVGRRRSTMSSQPSQTDSAV